ncbi:MAG: Hemerythrin cation binding domain protein [Variovorax sp.]|nr:Hemerythrin cation binding domain protein [Variovorax sp.]
MSSQRTFTQFLPSVTNMIRLDHTHVVSTFHQYKTTAPERVKLGLVQTICAALEVHAQLEEEIFYPAVRPYLEASLMQESIDEHAEMKRVIAELRAMSASDARYDERVNSLMRDVMHHVADEETIVLPAAESFMYDRLGDLGLRMTKRRLELVLPRSGEIALNMARAASGNKLALAVLGLAAGLLLLKRQRAH